MMRLGLQLTLIGMLTAALAATAFAGANDGRLDIYWIDVEGGAATLIVTPSGESVLIDTGNPGHRDSSRIAAVATRQAGLRKIDHLIITHYHVDHFGGASMLSRLLPIGQLYDNGEFEGQPNFPDKDYLTFKCDQRNVINPGDKIPLKQLESGLPVALTCLGTRQQFMDPPADAESTPELAKLHQPKNRDGSDNANSAVLRLDFGPFRFLNAADLTWNVEYKLVHPVNLVGKVDVYQVTHHGLAASNNPVVLQAVEPTVAVMNNGTTKGAAPEVFENLWKTPSVQAIYQMHKNLRPDGDRYNSKDEYIANLEEACDGNFIHLSVTPDGKQYTVSVPARDHQQTYETR